MVDTRRERRSAATLARAYKALKYIVYALLSVNIALFLNEEMASSAHAAPSGMDLFTVIQLFSATLDTAAWVLLLLLLWTKILILLKQYGDYQSSISMKVVVNVPHVEKVRAG